MIVCNPADHALSMSRKDTVLHMTSSESEHVSRHDPKPDLRVVGIGASAGGLSALRELFSRMPDGTGLAFVVVVHLSPEHKSHLPELLQPHSSIPIAQVTETVPLEPNRIYVIPPNANLNTIDTHLRLSELEELRGQRAPIDHFLRTLAETHGELAIGIILTGTGTDGTLGMRQIKEHGGLTIAQDPGEAEYDGMPRSAIASGTVDLVLRLEEMPGRLIRFARSGSAIPMGSIDGEAADTEQTIDRIFSLLRSASGTDYSVYKPSTVIRRIRRRMQLQHVDRLPAYLELLGRKKEEARALADDLLITVTEFFRDAETFVQIEKEVIAQLFDGKQSEDQVRIWSVGCSTGEEAYSLAMLLLEEASRRQDTPRLQVFASDLQEAALNRAREGLYPESIHEYVSPERLERFFAKEGSSYRIRPPVREIVTFAPHDLLRDPPFAHLDMVSCRNLMIYLQNDAQRDALGIVHYALGPDGFLVLGSSESAERSELFTTESKEHCIYRKRNVPSRELHLQSMSRTTERSETREQESPVRDRKASHAGMHLRMVERYAPPSLLVDERHEVAHTSQHIGQYLQYPGGELSTNLFRIVRDELRTELRTVLHSAAESGTGARSRPIPLRIDGENRQVVLRARPARDPELAGFFLVIFDEPEEQEPVEDAPERGNATMRELEAELNVTKKRLQRSIEEHESDKERMQASLEESRSANEELRSTIEEFETSKEELQSMNEELATVNQENRHRVAELSQLTADLQNLNTATGIPTLFLDRTLRILRYTPAVEDLFNIRQTDRGRPLSDITHRLVDSDLQEDARNVLDRLVPVEREILSENERWFLTRVLPYRGPDDRIEGVVVTFVDITERKRAEQELAHAKEYAESIVATLHEPLIVLTPDFNVENANVAFYRHFQVSPGEILGRRIYDLGNRQWDIPLLRTLLEDVLPHDNAFNEYEVTHDFEGIGRRTMLLNGRRLDHVQQILLGIRDITERKLAEQELRESEERLKQIFNIEGVGVLILDEPGTITGANDAFLHMTGYTRERIQERQMSWRTITPPEYVEATERQLQRLVETGLIGPYEKECLHSDGSRSWLMFAGASLQDGTRIEYCIDVSDRKRVEEQLRQEKERAQAANTAKSDFLAHMSHEIRTPIGGIIGMIDVLAVRIRDPEQRSFLAMVRESAESLLGIIGDILDLSRIEAGHSSVEADDWALRDTLESQLAPFRISASERGLEFTMTIGAGAPRHVRADRNKIGQVLRNLVSNAMKYTRQGTVRVTVESETRPGGRARLRFRVSDTGAGIPEDRLSSIFESFVRLRDSVNQRNVEGTGLGLTIVKRLVEMLGGSIEVESELGTGSVFTFTVDVDAIESVEPDRPSENEAGHEALAPLRILLAEDNRVNQTYISTMLTDKGHEVTAVGSGTEAVAAIESAGEQEFDLVLMDIQMPEMDGIEATRQIRQLPGRASETPIIALTAFAMAGDEERYRIAGMNNYVTKPIDWGDLALAIRELGVGAESGG